MHLNNRLGSFTNKPLILGTLLILGLFTVRQITGNSLINLPNAIRDFSTLSASIIIEALPFVLLGIIVSIIVQVWVSNKLFLRLIPKRKLPRRLFLSSLGIFLPVCECGNVPLARGLMIKGLSTGDSITFLLAAPIINPITIITTQQAFGGDSIVLITRLLGGLLIANIVGWIIDGMSREKALITDEFSKTCKVNHKHQESSKINKSLKVFITETNVIMPALFIGSFVAGLIQVAVPRDILIGLGGHAVLSILAMMLLAFVVSICANVDAFFALAFASTFTTGSIVTFLVFGPIVDIKMLNLMRTTYKKNVLVIITLITILISGFLGLVVNYAF